SSSQVARRMSQRSLPPATCDLRLATKECKVFKSLILSYQGAESMKFRPILPLLVFAALIGLFGGPAARSAPLAAVEKVYLPLVVNPLLSDLSIDSLEITQAVQTSSNSVPLVANRQTLVRVYARVTGGAPLGNVALTLTGTRNGVALPPVNASPQA